MANLAGCFGEAGQWGEAAKLFEQTFQLSKAKLGPDHPDTLTAMHSLAVCYGKTGQWGEAVKLHEQTFQLTKAKLGPDHPATLSAMANLAVSYRESGRRDEALNLEEQTLQLTKAKLGPDHPSTLSAMANLAVSYSDANRREEAIGLFEAALKLMQAKLGPNDPITLMTMKNLVQAFRKVGRQAEAIKLAGQMLELRKARLGPSLGVYPRSADASAELLDLSASFNAGLKEAWLNADVLGNDLALLPHGLQTFGGVQFDARGIVQLQSKALTLLQPEYPDRVESIAVGQKCQRLHFLHGAGGTNAEDATIARYLVHYSDGQRQAVPVRYGQEVLNWHQTKDPPGKALAGAVIAWEGSQPRWANQATNCLRLYRMTWENPRPDVPIDTLDFFSAMEDAAPFLLAITVE